MYIFTGCVHFADTRTSSLMAYPLYYQNATRTSLISLHENAIMRVRTRARLWAAGFLRMPGSVDLLAAPRGIAAALLSWSIRLDNLLCDCPVIFIFVAQLLRF